MKSVKRISPGGVAVIESPIRGASAPVELVSAQSDKR